MWHKLQEVLLFNRIFNPSSMTKRRWYPVENNEKALVYHWSLLKLSGDKQHYILENIWAIGNVFRVCIAWHKHERGWKNSRQLCKPKMKSRVCITVENSPNPSCVYIRLCKHRKKVFYCFYKITFPRKTQNSLLWNWLKEKFLPVTKSCTRRLSRVISSCFAKRCIPKYGFFSFKNISLSENKIDTACL